MSLQSKVKVVMQVFIILLMLYCCIILLRSQFAIKQHILMLGLVEKLIQVGRLICKNTSYFMS